jgi:NADH-quinone oxidoreductase subunit L
MFLACGVGAFTAAIFHVITHAFFKALLFLGSGSVIHGMHHEQDMRRMGGLRKYMPITFKAMFVGWLAISGIPVLAGFFSKDEILWKTWSAGSFALPSPMWSKLLWFVAAVTALLTAVYMTRMMVMTFWGSERFREAHAEGEHQHDNAHHVGHVHEPHESPWTMTVPLIVLAILSTVGGFIGVPYALSSIIGGHPENYLEQVLHPVVAQVPEGHGAGEPGTEPTLISPPPSPHDGAPAFGPLDEHGELTAFNTHEEIRLERLLAFLSILIAFLGGAIGWVIFRKRPLLQLPRLLENKYYVDEIYDAAIINPIKVGSREGLWKLFDIGVIDGFLHSLGDAVKETGKAVRHMQAGFVRGYAAIILLGALAVVAAFAYYGLYALRP